MSTSGDPRWEEDYLAACKRRCRLYSAPYIFLASRLGEPAAIALAPLILPPLIEAAWSEADELLARRYSDAINEEPGDDDQPDSAQAQFLSALPLEPNAMEQAKPW